MMKERNNMPLMTMIRMIRHILATTEAQIHMDTKLLMLAHQWPTYLERYLVGVPFCRSAPCVPAGIMCSGTVAFRVFSYRKMCRSVLHVCNLPFTLCKHYLLL